MEYGVNQIVLRCATYLTPTGFRGSNPNAYLFYDLRFPTDGHGNVLCFPGKFGTNSQIREGWKTWLA